MLVRIYMRWDDGCILCEWHCIIFSMEAFSILWRPTVGQQFSPQHHCCILAAVYFFCCFLTSLRIRYMALCIPKQPPQCHLIPFSILFHIVLKTHTHTAENFQRMLFSLFLFEGASSHTLGNRNHFTFFLVVFHYFSFLLYFFLPTVFYYLNGASFSVHKTTIFFRVVSFCGGWKNKKKNENMEGGLQRKLYFSVFE